MNIDMQEIGQELLGTAKTLDDVLKEHGTTFDSCDRALLDELDEITMVCDLCGWWHPSDEINDDQYCEECADEE